MLVGVYGPENPEWESRDVSSGGLELVAVDPVRVAARFLGEALDGYSAMFGVSFSLYEGEPGPDPWPHGGPKYFHYRKAADDQLLVDIHILRDGEEICPKQNLDFELQAGDIIQIGVLVC